MSHWSSPTVPGIQIQYNCMKYQLNGSKPKSKLDEKETEG